MIVSRVNIGHIKVFSAKNSVKRQIPLLTPFTHTNNPVLQYPREIGGKRGRERVRKERERKKS